MAYNFQLPLNTLSFGHCGFNILEELHKRKTPINLFQQGGVDISAYKASEDLQFYISQSLSGAQRDYLKTSPGFKLWHILGAEESISNEQVLFTFHEVDRLTPHELNVLRNQKSVLVSSKFSEHVFRKHGLNNVRYCPLGFDATHFKKLTNPRKRANDNAIHFSLYGKYEKRKRTEKVIRAWIAKYGKNASYHLNLHVYNNFFSPEQNNQILLNVFNGQKPFNVTCHNFTKTLVELNEHFNETDIVMDMSGGEGFSIPSFSVLALGKHGVVHNCSSIKDWAGDSGAVLVNPSGLEPVYDGFFFKEGEPRNQGNIFTWDEDEFINACETAVNRFKANPVNEKGLLLPEKYTWAKTVDVITEELDK